ncbi:MAG: hypothetical protein TREMPRED_000099, partial [Tremellales sp. Tagirdzhanova-0007]
MAAFLLTIKSLPLPIFVLSSVVGWARKNNRSDERHKGWTSMLKNLPTFRSLPQAIGLPFLSTTEDAQLKFKSGDFG